MNRYKLMMLGFLSIFVWPTLSWGQIGPIVIEPVFHGESPPLTTLLASADARLWEREGDGEVIDYEVPNPELLFPALRNGNRQGADPVRQTKLWRKRGDGAIQPPELSFEGTTSADNAAIIGVRPVPPDTEGDVGKDYYIQMNNDVSEIFNKRTGASVTGPFANNLFFAGTGAYCEVKNDGDPIVLYDHETKRWIFSQLAIFDAAGNSHQCFAVSKTHNPLGAYYLYDYVTAISQLGGQAVNDYEKIGVWRDGLYYSHNEFDFGPAGTFRFAAAAIAFDKAAMYAGAPAPKGIKFLIDPGLTTFTVYLLPSHWEGNKKPRRGAPNIYWQAFDEEVFGDGSGVDGYRQWAFSADFRHPESSSFVELPRIVAPPFNLVLPCERNCFDQPSPGTVAEGNGLDDIGLRAMYRAQWRSFGQYDSVVLNQTVNADGSGTGGVRWVEMRDYGSGFELFQTGTVAPADGDHRFMGSIAQDRKGNIALGYSVTGLTTYPSVRYTGRSSDDPLGEMQAEVECHAGTGVQIESANRWGDYSAMSVDPQDDCTFWYTQEYYETNIPRDFKTRVCSFRFDNCRSGGPHS